MDKWDQVLLGRNEIPKKFRSVCGYISPVQAGLSFTRTLDTLPGINVAKSDAAAKGGKTLLIKYSKNR